MKLCESCPWNCTSSSEMAQNLGCLPTPKEMVKLNSEGKALSCHDDESIVCKGLRCGLKKLGEEVAPEIKKYTDWYRGK